VAETQVRFQEVVVVDHHEMDYQTLQEAWSVDNNAWVIIHGMLMVVSWWKSQTCLVTQKTYFLVMQKWWGPGMEVAMTYFDDSPYIQTWQLVDQNHVVEQ